MDPDSGGHRGFGGDASDSSGFPRGIAEGDHWRRNPREHSGSRIQVNCAAAGVSPAEESRRLGAHLDRRRLRPRFRGCLNGLPPLVGFLAAGFVLEACGVQMTEALDLASTDGLELLF